MARRARKCSRTGKPMLPNELEAKIALAAVQGNISAFRHQRNQGNEPCRPYRCEFCGKWHLTGQTKGEGRGVK